jgi:glycosyltransferase involved in cell wall biosynthesis
VYLRCVMGVEPDRIVTWPLYNPTLSEAPVPQWDGVGPLRIGSAGRLHPQKNYETFIRSIDRLRWEDPQTFSKIEVSIAGDGPLREGLEQLIKSLGLEDKFKLMGWVSDIPAYLRGLHLYVQPSLYEGMCIASHEAMAAGLPVIATPVGEMRRSVQPGCTGVLIKGDIVRELADAIRGFVAHPMKLTDFGTNGRDYVMRTMGDGAFSENGAKVLALIEETAMNRRKRFAGV